MPAGHCIIFRMFMLTNLKTYNQDYIKGLKFFPKCKYDFSFFINTKKISMIINIMHKSKWAKTHDWCENDVKLFVWVLDVQHESKNYTFLKIFYACDVYKFTCTWHTTVLQYSTSTSDCMSRIMLSRSN